MEILCDPCENDFVQEMEEEEGRIQNPINKSIKTRRLGVCLYSFMHRKKENNGLHLYE